MNTLGTLLVVHLILCHGVLYSGYAVNSNKVLFWSIFGEILEEISNYSKCYKIT